MIVMISIQLVGKFQGLLLAASNSSMTSAWGARGDFYMSQIVLLEESLRQVIPWEAEVDEPGAPLRVILSMNCTVQWFEAISSFFHWNFIQVSVIFTSMQRRHYKAQCSWTFPRKKMRLTNLIGSILNTDETWSNNYNMSKVDPHSQSRVIRLGGICVR